MVRLNQITQVLDEIALLLTKLKERPSTPALSERIKHLCERRTKILAKLGWLPFTPVTAASQEMRSAEPFSNRVQETSLMENDTNGQRSASVAMVSLAQLSARMQARHVDYVERMKVSVVRPGRITIPRTPKDTAPLSRRWGNQTVEAEDAQSESVPCMTADTQPLQRRDKRQRTKAEDMQLQFFHQKNDSVVWHYVPGSSRITIPRTPEDTAPLSCRWNNQRVEAEDAQFTPVPHMSADTAPLQRRS